MMLPESHAPPLGRELSVRVSYLDGSGFLWLQLKDLDDEFERLYADLHKGLEEDEEGGIQQDALLVSGAFVAAQHTDGLWHRAQLLSSTDNNGPVRVRFVDYGNEETLMGHGVRALPHKLSRRPPAFAIKCCLRGCEKLNQQTLNSYLSILTPDRATFYFPDGNVHPVKLSSSKPTSLNALLSGPCAALQQIQLSHQANTGGYPQHDQTVADAIKNALWPEKDNRRALQSPKHEVEKPTAAAPTHQIQRVNVRKSSSPPKPFGPLFQNAINDISPQRAQFSHRTLGSTSIAASDETSLDNVESSDLRKMFAVKKLAQVEQLDEWQPAKTPVGAELKVELCEVESPDDFKLSISDGYGLDRMCRMLSCLKDELTQIKNIECGICCLFCDGNNRERVTVADVHPDGSVDVFCVDTGRTKKVPRQKLCLNSSRRVRNTPCLSFSARLDAPRNVVWTENARKVLLKTAACGRIQLLAKIEGIESTGVRSVTLRSEKGNVSQLVMRANNPK